VVVEDSNARKEVERQLLRLQADLEARVWERTAELQGANNELDSFAYTVSHDLRGPLRAMAGFSQALIEDLGPKLAGDDRGNLDQVIRASVRMSELIDGLLLLSRITRGELSREWVDLSSLASLVRQELEQGQPGRGAIWDLQDGLTAWGDRRLLEALLRNLLGNAWKYTASANPARIRLVGLAGGHQFQVADNGAGFDMAHAGKLFQPPARATGRNRGARPCKKQGAPDHWPSLWVAKFRQ
jgi:light-regulated signal transduction histidine kinase (bacteriophytochrome)